MIKNLDMDCLRTFITILNLGSFAETANHLGRTAPAISLQMKRLEDQLGTKLFEKQGRNLQPSPAGEQLRSNIQQILTLNDQIINSLSKETIKGNVNIGAIQDYAENFLPAILSEFCSYHPELTIKANIDRTKTLTSAVNKGTLDLAIALYDSTQKPYRKIKKDKMQWLANPSFELGPNDVVPLVVFNDPCSFRQAAIEALDEAKRKWEIIFTSPSLSGLEVAIKAGLGITVRTLSSFQGTLRPLPNTANLPKLPSVDFALYAKPNLSVAAEKLRDIIIEKINMSK